ncbi:MAG: hypothetical protein H0T60_13615, partial [Acidobacteria bacterium]|nr:hypothetical protein [Acidobacteriota bacterium]
MSTREVFRSQPAETFPLNTGRLLQRKCACGQHTGGGECHACAGKSQLLQRHSARRTGGG